ncbi:MAG: prepilin-type N-terminal cleavage/methylation domain-containing protein [Christensenellaceae bacterium]|jgi:prepilin-type N-terminal cleavage/methylation domain-containing protein
MRIPSKNNKKGFTLMELIIVIAILAILAAILVPSILGYMNKAKEIRALEEGRMVVMAASTIAAENYVDGIHNPNRLYDTVNKVAIRDLAAYPKNCKIGDENPLRDGPTLVYIHFHTSIGIEVWYKFGEYYLEDPGYPI